MSGDYIYMGADDAPSNYEGSDTEAFASLNHALVPFLGAPVVLRKTDTRNEALNYAAGGFHVSVARGLAGGCKDSAGSISTTKPSACSNPLNRADVRAAWSKAADAYKVVYSSITGGSSLDSSVQALRIANTVADSAYKLEGVSPPRDPQTGTVEPPMDPIAAGFPWWSLPLLAVVAWWAWKKGKPSVKRVLRKPDDYNTHLARLFIEEAREEARKKNVKTVRATAKKAPKRLGASGRIVQKVAPLKKRQRALPGR